MFIEYTASNCVDSARDRAIGKGRRWYVPLRSKEFAEKHTRYTLLLSTNVSRNIYLPTDILFLELSVTSSQYPAFRRRIFEETPRGRMQIWAIDEKWKLLPFLQIGHEKGSQEIILVGEKIVRGISINPDIYADLLIYVDFKCIRLYGYNTLMRIYTSLRLILFMFNKITILPAMQRDI